MRFIEGMIVDVDVIFVDGLEEDAFIDVVFVLYACDMVMDEFIVWMVCWCVLLVFIVLCCYYDF